MNGNPRTSPDPARVQSFWHGDDLSPYERMCIRSFLYHGHPFYLYSYSADLNVPDGCILLDAAEILPQSRLMFYRQEHIKGKVSLFSNVFRYKLLNQTGGWWVDLDVVCLTDKLPDARYVFGYQNVEKMIAAGVVKAPPGNPLTARCLERSLEVGAAALWGQTGPRLFTQIVNELGLNDYARPTLEFYPYHWNDAMNALDHAHTERLLAACKSSTFVHLWNEVLSRNEVDKLQPPPSDSLLGRFFELYGWG